MSRRSLELRRTHRRVLGWSLGVAVLLHVGVFVIAPQFETVLPDRASPRAVMAGGEDGEARWIDVTFGPPTILLGDGLERREPPGRVLEARSVNIGGIALEPACERVEVAELRGGEATVALQVGRDGRVRRAGVIDGSGNACVNEVLAAVAGTLWYRWLPDAGAPAPVEVLQPMTVEASM